MSVPSSASPFIVVSFRCGASGTALSFVEATIEVARDQRSTAE
jgi:hypothetical protein